MKSIQILFLYLMFGYLPVCKAQPETSSDYITHKFVNTLKNSNGNLIDENNKPIKNEEIQFTRVWNGDTCQSFIQNNSGKSVKLSNIILFDLKNHYLPPASKVYGEGFQMLHQNGGTLKKRENIGNYPDITHYRIPDVNGLPTAYGLLEITVGTENHLLLGFTSCNRFIGRISYDSVQMQISLDAEGLTLKPGEKWALEEFVILAGKNRPLLFNKLAIAINKHHPRISSGSIPTGWCSWYCYAQWVTAHDIMENLDSFSKKLPQFKYIQIDDGYEPYFGDWLDKNPEYGDVQQTLNAIRQKGFEPAIWLAPFIAETQSRIFKEHPDWFVKDTDGKPLNSATIGFGGFRNGPWYVLDGTHPEVQKHLENLIRTIREKWGVNYFKLDANYWGAIHKGIHYDTTATRIEAYRRGLQAILRGCDRNSVVLGCNAPIWPSLGLVTAMRTSNDITREWVRIKSIAYENLNRAWQNGTLWDSDPDCVVLANDTLWNIKEAISNNEWIFHATVIHAIGGSVLSGDRAANLTPFKLEILKKLLKPTGKGASFPNTKFEVGITDMGNKQYYYFFNWGDSAVNNLTIQLTKQSTLTDFWTGEKLGVFAGKYTVKELGPHSARLIEGN